MAGAIVFNSSSSNSLNSSFGIGISAVNAARLALQTIGHNIANVNTPGYSRQQVNFSARTPTQTSVGAIGRGVDVTEIQSLRDRFVEAQLAIESQEVGRLSTRETLLDRMESMFNPANGLGLSSSTDSLFGAFQDLAANPENRAQREATITEAMNLGTASKHVINQMEQMKRSINDDIRATIDEINTLLEEIAGLNVQLAGASDLNLSLSDVQDERNLRFRELNELIDLQGYEDEDGALTVITGNGTPLVVGNQHATLTTAANSLDPNALDVIVDFNGSPANITKLIRGGTMGALLEVRDVVLEDALSKQRLFAAVLSDTVNAEHRLGTDLQGNAGGDFWQDPFKIVDNSPGADVSDIVQVGDNATFEINYSISPSGAGGVSITDIDLDTANLNALTKHDYGIEFGGPAAGDYSIIDRETGNTVSTGNLAGPGTINVDGLNITFDGQPPIGASFELSFDGRTGMTGDVYRIEWLNATDYEVYNLSDKIETPISTGTLAGNGLIFFDGLAVNVTGARVAGDSFKIDYADLQVSDTLTPDGIAASGSAPGLAEPGNNENMLRLGNLGQKAIGALTNRSFSLFQGANIASIGNERSSTGILRNAQDNFFASLNIQRESTSGVNLDEEAADLIQFQQSYTAAARYITQVNQLLDFLINALGS